MAITRITTDVSDGNNSRGLAFGTSYLIASAIPSGATITRIEANVEWESEVGTNSVGITSFTLAASYPYVLTFQRGAAGFTPVAPSIANYGNSGFMAVEQIPTVSETSTALVGTTDMFYWFTTSISLQWTGELKLSASTDIWMQAAAQHDATPQSTFQQHGVVNVFYG